MNKKLKIFLIGLVAIFISGILGIGSVQAQNPNDLVVEYWTGTEWKKWLPGEESFPIFKEENFLPGENISRLIQVTNKSGQSQRIATEAINVNDSGRLGDVLNLEIKENGNSLYNRPLSTFFNEGEVFLSNLAGNGAQTQYDFIVSFYSGAGNPFQGKTLSFDILIGFQGTEGGLLPGAGGGGGGVLPPGLTIQDESVRATTTETSATIIWTTSYFSTSQVIYAAEGERHTLDLTDNIGTPPKYGYAHTTPEFDISPKVTAHTVTITGLTPGTKYYYRAVSHGSLAISREYSFTTLEVKSEEKIEEEIPPYEEEIPAEEVVLVPSEEEIVPPKEIIPPEEVVPGEEVPEEKEKLPKKGAAAVESFLATIAATPLNLKIILIMTGIVIIGLIVIGIIRKRKRIKD